MNSTPLRERLVFDRGGLRPGSWSAYLAATAIVAAATVAYLVLAPWLANVQLITFFAAVVLAPFLCGSAAGFLSVALSALSAWAFVMTPAFALGHVLALVLFCVISSSGVVIISALQQAANRVGLLNSSLRDSETRYRTLADNASDLIILQGIDRQFQFISPACRRLGYKPEEMSALRPESLVHPDDLETVFRTNGSLSAERPTAKSVLRVRHKDGSYVWAEAVYNWVAARPDGQPQILTVARDITERKIAEDAAARHQALLNDAISAIDDGIAIYDSEERLIVANAALHRLTGWPAELLEPGRTFSEIADRAGSFYKLQGKALAAFRARHTGQFRSADGTPDEQLHPSGNWIHLRYFRTREGGVVAVATNITLLKTAAIELDQARAKAEAASIAKSRFLAAASHDLRQPLQTISLLEGILRKSVTDPQAASTLDNLDMSLRAMSGILDNLLEINQLEAGIVKPIIEDFAIGDLLERLRVELTHHADAKGLALHVVHCSSIVRSDPKLLEQIVRNLLSNAIKYTQTGRILLGCRRAGAALQIDVMDTGIGIPDDHIEAIFEEFHQVDNPARDRRRGLGLGLSIVQRLSSLLHHSISVRSALGKGSVFSVEVPLGKRAETVPARKSKPTRGARPTRVLLVEDDAAVLTSLRMLLELNGHEIVAAEDAAQALAHVRQTNFRPEVIVSDFNLPGGVDGVELIELVRSEFREQIPAIVLTGDVLPETQESLSAAACMVLNKPVDADTLAAAIEECRLIPPIMAVPPPAPGPRI